MKTFKDLEFKHHQIFKLTKAVMFFENGYGVSVIRFIIDELHLSRTSNESEWELAVIKGDEKQWSVAYDTPISVGIIGYLSESEVSELMRKIQELPNAKKLLIKHTIYPNKQKSGFNKWILYIKRTLLEYDNYAGQQAALYQAKSILQKK